MSGPTILARGLLVLGLLVSPACLSSGSGRGISDQVPAGLNGVWGGTGVRLTLAGRSGTIEFDCGGATVEDVIVSRSNRRFRAVGKVFPATGGPAIYPPPPWREPREVKYRGRFEGDRLRLVIVYQKPLRSGETRRAVFRLEHDRPGRLVKCR